MVSLAASECNNVDEFRSIVKENQNNSSNNKKHFYSFKELIRARWGRFICRSIKPHNELMNIYQGIIQINDRGVDYSLEHYLNKSEQLNPGYEYSYTMI